MENAGGVESAFGQTEVRHGYIRNAGTALNTVKTVLLRTRMQVYGLCIGLLPKVLKSTKLPPLQFCDANAERAKAKQA